MPASLAPTSRTASSVSSPAMGLRPHDFMLAGETHHVIHRAITGSPSSRTGTARANKLDLLREAAISGGAARLC